VITYSPALTLVPTYECFNRCAYCNFRVDPGSDAWMTLEQARSILTPFVHDVATGGEAEVQTPAVIEVLILSGEVHPHSSRRQAWFERIYQLCDLALSLGLLPHTNVGPLSMDEMAQLKQVNVSMGLMLEQLTPDLLDTVHRHAPSKVPELRMRQMQQAGELQIPFTTGLLLGIGETEADWRASLEAIARLHQTYGHIQEVILQPYSQGTQQAEARAAFALETLVEVVAIAREILPDDITLQIPPNLVTRPQLLLACLDAGVRDLGGIGPKDEVNPDYPHPQRVVMTEVLASAGWQLQPRLPIYSHYDSWLPTHLQADINQWRSRLQINQIAD
jgi:FO synthase subunit 1